MSDQLLSAILEELKALNVQMKVALAPRQKARIERPEQCRMVEAANCARLSDDALITFGGMAGSGRGCRGCGETLET